MCIRDRGSEVNTSAKLYKDAKGFYRNTAALADDTLMYEVYHYTQGNDKRAGNLNWGLTVLYPVPVSYTHLITAGKTGWRIPWRIDSAVRTGLLVVNG